MQATFDRVAYHLQSLGIPLEVELNETVTSEAGNIVQEQLGVVLPESYLQFVTQFADGFQLRWSEPKGASTNFEMEGVESSLEGMLGMRDWRFYDEEGARKYGFPSVDDFELALDTNRRMHNWLPIYRVPNGDYISIDLNPDQLGQVIYDDHSWMDGGTGHNGYLMAPDITSFFQAWGSVCFSQPRSYWWKDVLAEAGVDWKSDQFDDRFRI